MAGQPPPPQPAPPTNPAGFAARLPYLLAVVIVAGLAYRGYAPGRDCEPSRVLDAPGLDLNHASADELEHLPGVGPSRAESIVSHRAGYGPYTDSESLSRAPGVGPATAAKVAPFVRITPPAVPTSPAPAPRPVVKSGAKHSPEMEPIDLNRATEAQLATLPGIGPALARRIADARPFAAVADLRKVKGIGAKTLANLEPHVTVSSAPGRDSAPAPPPSRAGG